MAIRVNADEGFQRTTGAIPNHNAAYSILARFRLVADTNAFAHFVHIGGDVDAYDGNTDFVGTDSDGSTLRWGCAGGASNSFSAPGPSLSLDTWYHIALVRESSTALKLYLDGALIETLTNNVGGRGSATEMAVGTFNALPFDGRFEDVIVYERGLTIEEVASLARRRAPINWTSLFSWAPCIDTTVTQALVDISGRGNSWTQRGTPTIEDGSGTSWGAPTIVDPLTPTAAGVTGTFAVTEEADSMSATGVVRVTGSMAVTEAADAMSASGSVRVNGAMAVTEEADTMSASAVVRTTGTMAVVEDADVMSASAAVRVTGAMAVVEDDDTMVASGAVGSAVAGTMAVTEEADAMSAAGVVRTVGSMAIVEDDDVMSASGSVRTVGSFAIVEADDLMSAAASVRVTGLFAVTEEDDVMAASGTVSVTTIVGTMAITEEDDYMVASAFNASASGSGFGFAWRRGFFSTGARTRR